MLNLLNAAKAVIEGATFGEEVESGRRFIELDDGKVYYEDTSEFAAEMFKLRDAVEALRSPQVRFNTAYNVMAQGMSEHSNEESE